MEVNENTIPKPETLFLSLRCIGDGIHNSEKLINLDHLKR